MSNEYVERRLSHNSRTIICVCMLFVNGVPHESKDEAIQVVKVDYEMARFVNLLIAFLCGVVWLKGPRDDTMAHNPSLQRMVKTLVPTSLRASLCQYWEHMWWLPFCWLQHHVCPHRTPALQNVWRHVAPKIFRGEFWGRERLPVGCSSSAEGRFTVLFWHSLTNLMWRIFHGVGTTPSCVITVARHKLSGLTRAAYLGGAFVGSCWTGLRDHNIHAASQELLGRHIYIYIYCLGGCQRQGSAETCQMLRLTSFLCFLRILGDETFLGLFVDECFLLVHIKKGSLSVLNGSKNYVYIVSISVSPTFSFSAPFLFGRYCDTNISWVILLVATCWVTE